MQAEVRLAHASCITALAALESQAAAALTAGALDELRPVAARLIEARKLLEGLPLDDAPPANLQVGAGVRRAVELCVWEVKMRIKVLDTYSAGAASQDERKLVALLRLFRSLQARLNGEADPNQSMLPPPRPMSPPALSTPNHNNAPLSPRAPMLEQSAHVTPLATTGRLSSDATLPTSPVASGSPFPTSPSTATSPALASASSARGKLPKLNIALSAQIAQSPQSVDELSQQTPRSTFFLRGAAHAMPAPPATPRTRDEGRRKAVAEGDVLGTQSIWTSLEPALMERDAAGAWLVQGGSVNRLIERASAPDCPDATFYLLFLLTFRTFLSPELLLTRLMERHAVPSPRPSSPLSGTPSSSPPSSGTGTVWKDEVQRPVQARVASLLRQWLELEGNDWCPPLRPQLAACKPLLLAAGHEALVQRIDALLAHAVAIVQPPHTVLAPQPRGIGPSENFLSLPPLEVMRYLCRSDYALLAGVRHVELLSHGWTRAEWADRCPALSKVIARFNALSHWLCSLILTLEGSKLRATMYARWVKIAKLLRRQGNFASLMAVVAALHNPAIIRLKQTLKEVPRKRAAQLEELEALMRPTSNFRAYREALLMHTPPSVPYMGVFLTDLTFIEDGNPDFISPSVVNFRKRRLLADVLLLVQRLQVVPYSHPRAAATDSFVENQLGISHDVKRLFELSLQREPRQP